MERVERNHQHTPFSRPKLIGTNLDKIKTCEAAVVLPSKSVPFVAVADLSVFKFLGGKLNKPRLTLSGSLWVADFFCLQKRHLVKIPKKHTTTTTTTHHTSYLVATNAYTRSFKHYHFFLICTICIVFFFLFKRVWMKKNHHCSLNLSYLVFFSIILAESQSSVASYFFFSLSLFLFFFC